MTATIMTGFSISRLAPLDAAPAFRWGTFARSFGSVAFLFCVHFLVRACRVAFAPRVVSRSRLVRRCALFCVHFWCACSAHATVCIGWGCDLSTCVAAVCTRIASLRVFCVHFLVRECRVAFVPRAVVLCVLHALVAARARDRAACDGLFCTWMRYRQLFACGHLS